MSLVLMERPSKVASLLPTDVREGSGDHTVGDQGGAGEAAEEVPDVAGTTTTRTG